MAFLSNERQPKVDFLHSSVVILNKFLGKLSLYVEILFFAAAL